MSTPAAELPEDGLVPTRCDSCRRVATVDYVTLEQNVGLVVVRFPKRFRGYLCRDCTAQLFWRYTLITVLFGWWGVVSFFVTFAVLARNVSTFLRTRALPPPPPRSGPEGGS